MSSLSTTTDTHKPWCDPTLCRIDAEDGTPVHERMIHRDGEEILAIGQVGGDPQPTILLAQRVWSPDTLPALLDALSEASAWLSGQMPTVTAETLAKDAAPQRMALKAKALLEGLWRSHTQGRSWT